MLKKIVENTKQFSLLNVQCCLLLHVLMIHSHVTNECKRWWRRSRHKKSDFFSFIVPSICVQYIHVIIVFHFVIYLILSLGLWFQNDVKGDFKTKKKHLKRSPYNGMLCKSQVDYYVVSSSFSFFVLDPNIHSIRKAFKWTLMRKRKIAICLEFILTTSSSLALSTINLIKTLHGKIATKCIL